MILCRVLDYLQESQSEQMDEIIFNFFNVEKHINDADDDVNEQYTLEGEVRDFLDLENETLNFFFLNPLNSCAAVCYRLQHAGTRIEEKNFLSHFNNGNIYLYDNVIF